MNDTNENPKASDDLNPDRTTDEVINGLIDSVDKLGITIDKELENIHRRITKYQVTEIENKIKVDSLKFDSKFITVILSVLIFTLFVMFIVIGKQVGKVKDGNTLLIEQVEVLEKLSLPETIERQGVIYRKENN